MALRKTIYFFIILISIIVILVICFQIKNAEDEKLIYYEPKLYPVLDENYPPYRPNSKSIENPQVRLLSKTDEGIVFELIDSALVNPLYKNEPDDDSFYCILTDDRILKYFNGYIDYICYSAWDNEKVEKLGLSELIQKNGNNLSISNNLFQFRELYKEYTIKLTEIQYKEIINKLKSIDKKFEPTGEDGFSEIADRYFYKGLCFKSGYFDNKRDAKPPLLKNINKSAMYELSEKSEKEFNKVYDDFCNYVKSLIPNLETYRFE